MNTKYKLKLKTNLMNLIRFIDLEQVFIEDEKGNEISVNELLNTIYETLDNLTALTMPDSRYKKEQDKEDSVNESI